MTTTPPEPGRIRRVANRVSRWRQDRSDTKLGTNTLKGAFALGENEAKRTNPRIRERIGRAKLTKADLQQLATANVAAELNPERFGDFARQLNQEIARRIDEAGPDTGRTLNPVRAFQRWRNVRKGTNVLKGGYAQAGRDVKNMDRSVRREAGRRQMNKADLLSLAQGRIEQVIYPEGPRGPVPGMPDPEQAGQVPGDPAGPGAQAPLDDRVQAALLQIQTAFEAQLQQQVRVIAAMEAQQAVMAQQLAAQQAVIAQHVAAQQPTPAQATPQTPAQTGPAAQPTGPAPAAAQNTGPAPAPAAQTPGPAQNTGPAQAPAPAPAAAQNTGPAPAPNPAWMAGITPGPLARPQQAEGAPQPQQTPAEVNVAASESQGPPGQAAAQGEQVVDPTNDWMARGTDPDLGQSEELPAAQAPAAIPYGQDPASVSAAQAPAAAPSGQAAAQTAEPAATQQPSPLPIPAKSAMSKSEADLKAESATAQSKAFDGLPVATLNTSDGKVFPIDRPPTSTPHRATGPVAKRPQNTKGGD